jgi:hypothetical protein
VGDILFNCSVFFWDLIMMSFGIWLEYKNSSRFQGGDHAEIPVGFT